MASTASLSFDGVNDVAFSPDNDGLWPFGVSDFTVEAWYKDLNASNLNHARYVILAKGDRGITNCAVFFAVGFRNVELIYKNGGTTYTQTFRLDTAPESYGVNEWIHLAATFDATNRVIRLYVDGTLRATSATLGNGPPTVSEMVTVGAAHNGYDEFLEPTFINYGLCRVDEVRVWNVRRTDSEIAAYYTKQASGLEPNLVACYRFNEGSGTVADDISDFHELSITGATWNTTDFATLTHPNDWAYIKSGENGGGGTGGTINWNEGGSATSGNLLLAICTTRASDIDTPSGWLRGPEGINPTNNDRCVIFYKRSAGTETGFTFSHAGGFSDTWRVKIYEYQHSAGFDADPYDVGVGTSSTDSTSPMSTGTTGAVAQADSLAVAVAQFRDTNGSEFRFSNGFRHKYEEDDTSHEVVIGKKLLTTTGTVETEVSWVGTTTAGIAALGVFRTAGGGGGADTSTLSGSFSAGAVAVTGSLTHTHPTYTITGAVSIGSPVVSGALTNTPPTSILSGTVTPGAISVSGELSIAAPVFTLSGAVTAGPISVTGALQWTDPEYTLSGAVSVGSPTVTGALQITPPVYTLSGSVSIGSPTVSGSLISSSSSSILSGTIQVAAPTVTGELSVTIPTFTVSGSFQLGSPTVSGALEYTNPVYTLTGAVQLGAPTVTGELISSASASILSGAFTLGPPTVTGALQVSQPQGSTISGAVAIGKPTVAGTLTISPPVYTLEGVATAGAVVVTGQLIFVSLEDAPPVSGPLRGTVKSSRYYGIVRSSATRGTVK